MPMTKQLESHSPHYFINQERNHPVLNLLHRLSRSDAAGTERAHKAIIYLASLDLDHAQIANGRGFSKSDSKRGHNLARWPTERVIRSDMLGPMCCALARKYRKQLPPHLLVDPPS
jgi:hypothetical protein